MIKLSWFYQFIPFENSLLVYLRRLFYRIRFSGAKSWQKNTPHSTVISIPAPLELTGNSQDISLRIDNLSAYQLQQKLEADDHILKVILSSLRGNDIFWDIGANIGVYSVFIALNTPVNPISVVAFEPERESFELLKHNIAQNKLENIQAFNFALGSEEGEQALFVSKDPMLGGHTLLESSGGLATQERQSVHLEKGDSILMKFGLGVPNVIKIDTEGSEYDVLNGMKNILSQPSCHSVICEVHFRILHKLRGNVPGKIISCLKTHGFKIKKWLDPSHVYMSKRRGDGF